MHNFVCSYRGAEWAADYLANLKLPKDAKILDVCSGSGLVGKHLQGKGFMSKFTLSRPFPCSSPSLFPHFFHPFWLRPKKGKKAS